MPDDYDAEAGIEQAAELVELVLDAVGRGRGPRARRRHGPPRAGAPQRRGGLVGDPARAGPATHAAERMGERLAHAGAGSATTRTWARSPSPPGAPAAAPAGSSI